jgi:hypothetical protein
MNEQEDRDLTTAEHNLINEPGAIGEEVLPSGIEKTDKQEWDYTNRFRVRDDWFKRIRDWADKGWGR